MQYQQQEYQLLYQIVKKEKAKKNDKVAICKQKEHNGLSNLVSFNLVVF